MWSRPMDHVTCDKHGKTYVICTSNRLAYYECSMCWEEKVIAAEQAGERPPVIYD